MLLAIPFLSPRVGLGFAGAAGLLPDTGIAFAPAVSIPAVFPRQGANCVVLAVACNSNLKPKVADQLVTYRLPAKE